MEAEFIHWLRERLPRHPRLLLGPGDDAAILDWRRQAGCVVTVDLVSDGVDFLLPQVDPRRVGHKALAVNLSDLAAMAARPVAAVVALCLPRQGALPLAQQIYEGMIPLAERFELAIAGGDTNCWDGPLAISVTAIGEVTQRGPLVRSGARPGDAIVVTGRFGGSRLGHHLDFVPRVDEALQLAAEFPLHAGLDCSDGLSLDLSRLAAESRCGAVIELDRVPLADAAHAWARQCAGGTTALDHALGDGEDFELILAVPAAAARDMIARQPLACGLTQIGQFVAEPGLWQQDALGNRRPLAPRGYEHE